MFVKEKDAEKIRRLVKSHEKKLSKFIERNGNGNVPHKLYFKWLSDWFPDKVN